MTFSTKCAASTLGQEIGQIGRLDTGTRDWMSRPALGDVDDDDDTLTAHESVVEIVTRQKLRDHAPWLATGLAARPR
jgi:hypothetical protein